MSTFSRKNYFPRRIEKNGLTPTTSPPFQLFQTSLLSAWHHDRSERRAPATNFSFSASLPCPPPPPPPPGGWTDFRPMADRSRDQAPATNGRRTDGRQKFPLFLFLSPDRGPKLSFGASSPSPPSPPSAFPSFLFPLCPVGGEIRQ